MAKKIEARERRSTMDSHYHSDSQRELPGMAKRFRKDGIFGKVIIGKTNWKPSLVIVLLGWEEMIEGN